MNENKFSNEYLTRSKLSIRSFTTESEEWLTSQEAAQFLKVPYQSILDMCSRGQIPYYKFGRRNRYLKSELENVLRSQRKGGIFYGNKAR